MFQWLRTRTSRFTVPGILLVLLIGMPIAAPGLLATLEQYRIAQRALTSAQSGGIYFYLEGPPTAVFIKAPVAPSTQWTVVLFGDVPVITPPTPGIPEQVEQYHQIQVSFDTATGEANEQAAFPPQRQQDVTGFTRLSPEVLANLSSIFEVFR
jgi:hypothetical protein